MYQTHNRALMTAFADLENFARQQDEVFIGTAGSVAKRTNADNVAFYSHRFRVAGKERERYVAGPVGNSEADGKAEALRARISEVKDLVPTLRMLGREGFNLVDSKTFATVASLANHGVFRAGGLLIGSHAYGAILNRLGVRATPYATEDIDIARLGALAFPKKPTKSLLEMLRDSGVDFVAVPALKRGAPSTSFKEKGKARFQVDLLVPSADETFPTIEVPELKAHATGLPYLKYLLAESQPATVLAREGLCSVTVPVPERYAVHKLVVSQLRPDRGVKAVKDLHQATVLAAALGDLWPGALETATGALSRKMRKHFKRALGRVRDVLESTPAWDELSP